MCGVVRASPWRRARAPSGRRRAAPRRRHSAKQKQPPVESESGASRERAIEHLDLDGAVPSVFQFWSGRHEGAVRAGHADASKMPFVKRVVRPTLLCRASDASRTPSCDDGRLLKDDSELVAVSNCALSNAIRQLASLAGHAEDIFVQLKAQLGEINARASLVKERLANVQAHAENLNARAVTVRKYPPDTFCRPFSVGRPVLIFTALLYISARLKFSGRNCIHLLSF